jgi:hypothetical protein
MSNVENEKLFEVIKSTGASIGSMIITKTILEHDGGDTTSIDRSIEQTKDQLKRMVKIAREKQAIE